jgi:hypothetical protein
METSLNFSCYRIVGRALEGIGSETPDSSGITVAPRADEYSARMGAGLLALEDAPMRKPPVPNSIAKSRAAP